MLALAIFLFGLCTIGASDFSLIPVIMMGIGVVLFLAVAANIFFREETRVIASLTHPNPIIMKNTLLY